MNPMPQTSPESRIDEEINVLVARMLSGEATREELVRLQYLSFVRSQMMQTPTPAMRRREDVLPTAPVAQVA